MNAILRVFVVFITCFASTVKSEEYQLAVCTIFKDNAPWLKEWIEYHRMLGVDHFYLFDNRSTDNPMEILQDYVDQGVVSVIDWPNRDQENWGTKVQAWVETTQIPAYHHGYQLALGHAQWLAFIDTDEFIVPMKDANILQFLKRHQRSPGVLLFWQIYGTSNVYEIPPDRLMIEMLMLRSHNDHYYNTLTKMIIQPREFSHFLPDNPHQCLFRGRGLPYKAPRQEMRINHYINRTVQFLYEHKAKAKATMDNVPCNESWYEFHVPLGNDVEDRVMDRFIPALRQRMGL